MKLQSLPPFIPLMGAALLCFSLVEAPTYTISDTVEDFQLINVINSKPVSLSDYANAQGVVIVFTCLHCPYAQLYDDRLIQLHKEYAPKGFPVLAINPTSPRLFPEDSFENMREHARRKRYPFPYLQDDTQKIALRFGAKRTPHVFLLDKNRVVRYIGSIDDNPENARAVSKHFLRDAIQALLRGERPYPETAQAIGCPIRIDKQLQDSTKRR